VTRTEAEECLLGIYPQISATSVHPAIQVTFSFKKGLGGISLARALNARQYDDLARSGVSGSSIVLRALTELGMLLEHELCRIDADSEGDDV